MVVCRGYKRSWKAIDWGTDKAEDVASAVVDSGDALLRDYVDPVLRKVATPLAGFEDAVRFGHTDRIRVYLGTNDVIEMCSGW
jgi:hypothetical protein